MLFGERFILIAVLWPIIYDNCNLLQLWNCYHVKDSKAKVTSIQVQQEKIAQLLFSKQWLMGKSTGTAYNCWWKQGFARSILTQSIFPLTQWCSRLLRMMICCLQGRRLRIGHQFIDAQPSNRRYQAEPLVRWRLGLLGCRCLGGPFGIWVWCFIDGWLWLTLLLMVDCSWWLSSVPWLRWCLMMLNSHSVSLSNPPKNW